MQVHKSECAIGVQQSNQAGGFCSSPEIQKKITTVVGKKSYKEAIKKLSEESGCEGKEPHQVESCVLEKSSTVKKAVPREALHHNFDRNFNPKGPAKSIEWLSNDHIDTVLDQAADHYKGFFHIDFQMIDFAEKNDPDGLHRIDLAKKYKEGIKSFGVVLNTDTSDGSGEHWFCLYGVFDRNKITLEYFNSAGDPPMIEVDVWLRKTEATLSKKLNIPVEIIRHLVPHQTDDHSCGPYAVYYILSRLSGVPSKTFDEKKIPSSLMRDFREQILRE